MSSLLGPKVEHFVRVTGVTPADVSASLLKGHMRCARAPRFFPHCSYTEDGCTARQYALPVHIRRQCRRPPRAWVLFCLLPPLRPRRGTGSGLCTAEFGCPLIGASGPSRGPGGVLSPLSARKGADVNTAFFFFPVVELSAFFFLGFWFLLQFIQGALAAAGGRCAAGGVACGGSCGGFVAGAVLLPVFLLLRKL